MSKHRAEPVMLETVPDRKSADVDYLGPEYAEARELLARCRTEFTSTALDELANLLSERTVLAEAIQTLLQVDQVLTRLRAEQQKYMDRYLASTGRRGRVGKARAEAAFDAYAHVLMQIEAVVEVDPDA